MNPAQTVAATLIVTLGSLLQGTVGFGLGLFAAPLLLLVDPRLVPGPLLLVSGLLSTLMARRDWDSVRTGDLGWSLAGRVLGTGPALLALAMVPPERIEYLLGGIVLMGVLLTGSGFRVGLTPPSLFGAGFLSGIMGTTTTIGGPPMALVYQHETGPRIRGTLSAFFVAGVVISVAGLLMVRYEVKKQQVDMQPIRTLGEYTVHVRLTMDLVPEVKIKVHREGEALEGGDAAAEAPAEPQVEAPAETTAA